MSGKPNKNLKYVSWLSVPLLVFCGLLELGYPLQFFAGYGFIVAVLLTYFSKHSQLPFSIALLSVASIIAGIITTEQYNNPFYLLNNLSALAGVMLTLYFVLYITRVEKHREADNKQVNSLINFATEGIILTGQKGNILLANPHALEMFGYQEQELIGQRIEVLIPEAIRSRHVEHIKGFHQQPGNRSMGAGRDLYAKRKDDSVFPVEISLSYYHSGNEAYVIAFIIDITIRKQNELKLKQQTEELEQVSSKIKQLNTELEQKVQDRTTMLRETLAQLERNKDELAESLEKEKELGDLKSRFVSTVSHEFRTPLSTILSSAALIGKYVKGEEQDKRDRHVNRIKESVRHMNTLLEDLLLLGKLEEGITEVKPEVFDLRQFMVDVTSEMKEIAQKGQQIVLLPFTQDHLDTDKRLLKNIMINLMSNAIKFSPENSEIHIEISSNQEQVRISVKDSGIGIPKEDLQHLFERFFRARSAHNIPGTGLGLHIVSKYLELMGGDIEVESEVDAGTTFTIILPIAYTKPRKDETHTAH